MSVGELREHGPVGQQELSALAKNADYFSDNDWYKSTQKHLEQYRYIANSATHETRHAKRLLDIGNGGVFVFPIAHIPEVVAIDVFVEEDFALRYPHVQWTQMSALDMQFDRPFDTIVAVNTLHHIVDANVAGTYANLRTVIAGVAANLEPNGRFVLIESTVPRWFLAPYKLFFSPLIKLWPLRHPPTFQFNYRDILSAAEKQGLVLREFCWIPKTSDIMTLGFQVKPWMTPIQVGKFIFEKR
jgi:SAM-dependent methyltransferase